MTKKRQQYSPEYKFKVALEAAKGTKTLAEITSQTGELKEMRRMWEAPVKVSCPATWTQLQSGCVRDLSSQPTE